MAHWAPSLWLYIGLPGHSGRCGHRRTAPWSHCYFRTTCSVAVWCQCAVLVFFSWLFTTNSQWCRWSIGLWAVVTPVNTAPRLDVTVAASPWACSVEPTGWLVAACLSTLRRHFREERGATFTLPIQRGNLMQIFYCSVPLQSERANQSLLFTDGDYVIV